MPPHMHMPHCCNSQPAPFESSLSSATSNHSHSHITTIERLEPSNSASAHHTYSAYHDQFAHTLQHFEQRLAHHTLRPLPDDSQAIAGRRPQTKSSAPQRFNNHRPFAQFGHLFMSDTGNTGMQIHDSMSTEMEQYFNLPPPSPTGVVKQDPSPTSSPSGSPFLDPFPDTFFPPSEEETEQYLRATLSIPTSKAVNLYALPDEPLGMRNPKIADLIKLAIWGSPERRLTLRQIYDAVEERYPSLAQDRDKAWQRSIRHKLSMKAMFIKTSERPANATGRGMLWELNIRMGEGAVPNRMRPTVKDKLLGVKEEDIDDRLHLPEPHSFQSTPLLADVRYGSPLQMYPQSYRAADWGTIQYHDMAAVGPHPDHWNHHERRRSYTLPIPVGSYIQVPRRVSTLSDNGSDRLMRRSSRRPRQSQGNNHLPPKLQRSGPALRS